MSVVLATEDALSEAVGLRLLREHDILVRTPPTLVRKNGAGYLRARMNNWKKIAARQIVLLITDLDDVPCPLQLRADWLGTNQTCPANLLFRIAEREVEAWLLADHQAMTQLMGKKVKLPDAPDALPDPKQFLLKQAKNAPRAVRENLLAVQGAIARQGLGYNTCLTAWVKKEWSPQRAAEHSPSLARARRALQQAATTLA
ncbi:hypothetical protein [uncultured Cardiobacterium sp.]|jgi:hypothetical protein|uniref:hypothetical protein n=1 Tax=uncultured Cardiobacterium sp. TaxID=417619 RepID=UPI00262A145F|nr:hypothetical protein [uncultured Cardiobacterium sp.]